MTAPHEEEDAALARRFVTRTIDVAIAGGPAHLLAPRAAEDLIDADAFARDERLPYWADLWPSAIELARAMPTLLPAPARVVELGCGLGLVTIAALRAGHAVLATDYYDDALCFTRRNARANAGREPHTRLADWRAWPDELTGVDVFLAADVLYERAYATVVADLLARALAPGGVAIVADPGRVAVGSFLDACMAHNLQVSVRCRSSHTDGAVTQQITMHEIRRSAA